MGKVKFHRVQEFGSLSDYSGAPEFNLINWNGHQKYDIRRWGEDGEPYKGITVDKDELEDLLDILLGAIDYKRSSAPKYTIPCGKATAKIYADFGSFGYSGNMEKQVTYTDWGYGGKFDIRPWAEDFSACGKGITLDINECKRLIELIRDEIGTEESRYGISFEDFVVRSNIFRCNKNHELEFIQALISVLKYNGEVSNEIVSAGFCKHCNCYFILERDYLRLRNLGLPLCRQITEKAYRENGDELFNGEGLNPQSVLNQIGYNVNANEDLSNTQRQDNDLALTTEKYRQYTGANNLNVLNDLAFKNWVTIEHDEFEDEDNITVHQHIYELVEKDFYPSYESVPGITKYIESCFKVLEDMIIPEQSISDAVIDWESAKCITFALLMYDDIRRSESKETCSKKMGVLYGFMCIAFLEDANKLYELLFNLPEESTYYFYTHGIMDMFQFDVVENINRWSDWIKLLEDKNAESETLYCNISNGYVEFETQDEKKQYIDYIKTDAGPEYEKVFSNQVIVVPYFVMQLYFSNMNNDVETANNSLKIIMELEEILQKVYDISNELDKNGHSEIDMIEYRLNYYLSICNEPNYNIYPC